MTLGELRQLTKDFSDDTTIAVLRSDGTNDYNVMVFINGPGREIETEDGQIEVVISGD